VTRTVARHEAELEAAVERQTRLVREVHHRVKNNLQVVASLLNIHSRGSASEEAAAAYASIQRRVDALAVVHRNHYAELEKTPGVALRALISELGASLRASAPAGASRMQIRLSLEPLYANQDVAVSVAFLITETVEFAMLCGCNAVSITLESEEPGRGRLSIESKALSGGAACSADIGDRFERIITGLARQLRSTPDRDTEAGRFSLSIGIVGSEEDMEGD
jgi:two-component sensor histidine kinase